MIVARSTQVVRQFAARKIGVAAADQHEVAGKASIFVENSTGLDGGARRVIWPDQRERSGSGEQLGVGSRSEKLVRVLGISDFSGVDRHHFDAPESAGEVGDGKNCVNSFGNGVMRGGGELWRQQQAKKNREIRALSMHPSKPIVALLEWVLALRAADLLQPLVYLSLRCKT